MAKNQQSTPPALPDTGEILWYAADDGQVKLEVRLANETLWMTQQMMADLFQTTKNNISLHTKNIFSEGELSPETTVKDFLTVRFEGDREVQRQLVYYNLDMIISVGYRVKSIVATRFRIWSTQLLKQYIIKGFVLDDERLKNPPVAGSEVPDYFDEMLARIRDIRASERRMYLRVKEIFAMAGDYDPSLAETTRFFSIIQNKLHFAATGLTAAELIASRADHLKPNMGLTAWKGSEVMAADVTVAKNYLSENEIDDLNRMVVMWLDYAETQAKRRRQIFMKDWQQKLDDFLRFSEQPVLVGSGTVSGKGAKEKARDEYEIFAAGRRRKKEDAGEAELVKSLEILSSQRKRKK